MLFKILKDKPDYFVISWDSPKLTVRKEKYKQYKANRPILPDNFKWQLNEIQNIVKQIDIPYIISPGYEADDIIYSLVKKIGKEKNINLKILSADKDLKQLLQNENIILIDPQRFKTETKQSFIQKQ